MDAFNDSMQRSIHQNADLARLPGCRVTRLPDRCAALRPHTRSARRRRWRVECRELRRNHLDVLMGTKHRVLIVALDEDLGKWVAAFGGKPYYRGDFDACPNFDMSTTTRPTAGPRCRYCLRRHWDAFRD